MGLYIGTQEIKTYTHRIHLFGAPHDFIHALPPQILLASQPQMLPGSSRRPGVYLAKKLNDLRYNLFFKIIFIGLLLVYNIVFQMCSKVNYKHTHTHTHIYISTLFKILSQIGHCRVLSRVLCAIQ